MTEPSPAQQHIDTAAALVDQAADDFEQRRSAAAANNTALAQVHALLACARLLAEQNVLLTVPPEPAADPEPDPAPEPTPETTDAPTDDPDVPA